MQDQFYILLFVTVTQSLVDSSESTFFSIPHQGLSESESEVVFCSSARLLL